MSEELEIVGHTYPVKDQLRQMGARWDAKEKVWRIAKEKHAAAQAIVPEEETKQCWECGCMRTYREVKENDGDWNDDGGGYGTCYCGC